MDNDKCIWEFSKLNLILPFKESNDKMYLYLCDFNGKMVEELLYVLCAFILLKDMERDVV
jgi:hypothetical protein